MSAYSSDEGKPSATTLKLSSPASRFSTISKASVSGSGRVVQVFQTVVFKPEDVQAGFVAGNNFVVGKLPESVRFHYVDGDSRDGSTG